MARPPRFFVPGFPLHIVQRGNNRGILFRAVEDYRSYLSILLAASKAERCAIHAYVLMTNHIHLLATPLQREGASRMMKRVDQEYAQLHNRKYARCGGIYEGRFRASLVQTERYLRKRSTATAHLAARISFACIAEKLLSARGLTPHEMQVFEAGEVLFDWGLTPLGNGQGAPRRPLRVRLFAASPDIAFNP